MVFQRAFFRKSTHSVDIFWLFSINWRFSTQIWSKLHDFCPAVSKNMNDAFLRKINFDTVGQKLKIFDHFLKNLKCTTDFRFFYFLKNQLSNKTTYVFRYSRDFPKFALWAKNLNFRPIFLCLKIGGFHY